MSMAPTTATRSCRTIMRWFREEKGGSLEFPDRWFGRPMGNIHELTWIAERPQNLIMELDGQQYLIFTGLGAIKTRGAELVFSGFGQLVFDWQGYGDLTPHVLRYRYGQARFVSMYGSVERNLARMLDRREFWLRPFRAARRWVARLGDRHLTDPGQAPPTDAMFAGIISGWFAATGGGIIELPTGQHGEPLDAVYHLTGVIERPRKLILELDECLLLVFTELGTVRIEGPQLVFAGYRQLVVIWQTYGAPAPDASLYRDGEVRIVAAQADQSQ
jgi:hypothetical protein